MGYQLDPNDPNNPLNQYLQGKIPNPTAGLLSQYPQLAQGPAAPALPAVGGFEVDNPSGTTGGFTPPPAPGFSDQSSMMLSPGDWQGSVGQVPAPPPSKPEGPDEDEDELPVAAKRPAPAQAAASPAPPPTLDAPASPRAQTVNDILGDQYSDTARQELYDRLNKRGNAGSVISEAMSGLGDAIARGYGGQNTDYLKSTMANEQHKRQGMLDQFNTGRSQAIQDYTLGRQLIENKRKDILTGREDTDYAHKQAAYELSQEDLKKKKDPQSATSLGAVRAAELYDPAGAAKGLYKGKSAYDLEQEMDNLKGASSVEAERNKYKAEQGMRVDLKAQTAAENMSKDLDPSGWSSRSAAGQSASRLSAGQRAMQLIEQGKTQPGGLTQSQTQELATSVNALVSGGTSGAAREIDALVPHTLMGKTRSFEQYITSTPKGLQQPEFTQQLADTVRRETGLADSQVKAAQAQRLGGHQWLKQNKPELYQAVMQRTGIDPSTLDEKGNYKNAPTFRGQDSQLNEPSVTKTIGDKTYVRHNGQWYQQ